MGIIRRIVTIGMLTVGIVTAVASTADHGMSNRVSTDGASSSLVVATDTPWE